MSVLVDTSVWVDYLRPNGSGPAVDRLDELLAEDEVAITPPIVTELLRGIRSKRQRKQLDELIAAVPVVSVVASDWTAAGELLATLQRKGITVPTVDGLIAVVARRERLSVLTVDKHFRHFGIALAPLR